MATGVVTFFGARKGYTFVSRRDDDVFIEGSTIAGSGYKHLEQGEPVE